MWGDFELTIQDWIHAGEVPLELKRYNVNTDSHIRLPWKARLTDDRATPKVGGFPQIEGRLQRSLRL